VQCDHPSASDEHHQLSLKPLRMEAQRDLELELCWQTSASRAAELPEVCRYIHSVHGVAAVGEQRQPCAAAP
jgi:hypothetical protein